MTVTVMRSPAGPRLGLGRTRRQGIPAFEVSLELVGKVAHSGHERVGSQTLESAQGAVADVGGQGLGKIAVLGFEKPFVARWPSSYSRRTPMRHGMVLPHDSSDR